MVSADLEKIHLNTIRKKLVIMVDWSEERIAALSDQDLKNLLVNAERKSVAAVVAQCKAEMEKRDAAKPRKASKPRTGLKEFEHDMSAQLAGVGKEMAEKYDLSEETAKAKSAGVKGFRSHKLLDAKGYAKLGGHQRDGTVAVDRYISYRRGNDIVTLGVWLLKDAPIEDHEFHVSAPAEMIEGGKPFSEVRPGVSEKDLQETRHIRAFKDLPSAAAAFDAALAKITG
jgi:ribosomal protein L12E/L44/L45/RPP1/RPP2